MPDPEPLFQERYLDEITPALLQKFIVGLGVSRITMRHYREMLHHFFSVCLNLDLYPPTHWHRPNPVTALPSYLTRNRRILFLTKADVQQQLAILEPQTSFQMAVAIMIHAGLRRAEALWLTRNSMGADMSYLSVLNRADEEEGSESSLKTGERTLTTLPALRPFLAEDLKTLKAGGLSPMRRATAGGEIVLARSSRI